MTIQKHLAGIVAALLADGRQQPGGPGRAVADRLSDIWVGFGPLFVAQEKGFFAKEGVEVELINMAIHEAMYAGLFAGQVDVIGATVDDMLPHFDPAATLCLRAGDSTSRAAPTASSPPRTSGRSPISRVRRWHFPSAPCRSSILNVLLKEAGLSQADIEHVEMSADDAGNAFLMQEVDAAVTWEPWLTQGKQSEHGHLLADSSETPGLIVDCLVAKAGCPRRSPAGVPGAGSRLGCGCALRRGPSRRGQRDHGPPCRRLARGSRGLRRDPEGRPVLRRRKKSGILRHARTDPGQIYQTSQYAIDVWSSLGALDVDLSPADVIRHDLWVE